MKYWPFIISIILMSTGCANNTIENKLLKYHYNSDVASNSKGEINILIRKNVNENLSASLYYLSDPAQLFYAYYDPETNEVFKTVKINNKKSNSDFYNQGCVFKSRKNKIKTSNNGDLPCLSVFVGEVPFNDFSKIKLSWNCSETDIEEQKLLAGKYFFFIKDGLENRVCNIILTNNDKNVKIAFNPDDHQWLAIESQREISKISKVSD